MLNLPQFHSCTVTFLGMIPDVGAKAKGSQALDSNFPWQLACYGGVGLKGTYDL